MLAVSLPFPVVEGPRARRILDVVMHHLYTPYGLRSLAPGEAGYRGRYEGDRVSRDNAYHQGTVWAWMVGPLVSAWSRLLPGPPGKELLGRLLEPFRPHLRDAGVGFISEIFDGDAPHEPRGCIAQAWSVGEILRSYVEHVLQTEEREASLP